ncbi:MAG: DNA-deoxyinosine glycosylase [Lachnospiraceae bacterium]|nr:DNA-deoxyinosine glycosylase [Lachnospiraceae bacterium]
MEEHRFEPVFDKNSRILILGTFPSVKSRETNFYYGHPRNRFWKVVADVLGEDVPQTMEDKKAMLLRNGIALWDVCEKCEITGSSDSSIKNVVPVDIKRITDNAPIIKIFANGNTAGKLYDKYLKDKTGIEITVLPSTSPANAAFQTDRLLDKWKIIKEVLGDENV